MLLILLLVVFINILLKYDIWFVYWWYLFVWLKYLVFLCWLNLILMWFWKCFWILCVGRFLFGWKCLVSIFCSRCCCMNMVFVWVRLMCVVGCCSWLFLCILWCCSVWGLWCWCGLVNGCFFSVMRLLLMYFMMFCVVNFS